MIADFNPVDIVITGGSTLDFKASTSALYANSAKTGKVTITGGSIIKTIADVTAIISKDITIDTVTVN
jgi:hypothetical protein